MVKEVTVVTQDLQTGQEDFRQQATERFTQQDAALAQMFESFRRYQAITGAQGQPRDNCNGRCRELTPATSRSVEILLPEEGSSSSSLSPSSDESDTIVYEVARSRESSFTKQSGLRVQTTTFEQNSCGPDCSCICHIRNKLQIGNRLGGILGTLSSDILVHWSIAGLAMSVHAGNGSNDQHNSRTIFLLGSWRGCLL